MLGFRATCAVKKNRPKLSLLVTKHGRVNNGWDASTVAMGAKGDSTTTTLASACFSKGRRIERFKNLLKQPLTKLQP